MSKLTQCLWFTDNAEEAARFYTGLLPDSRIDAVNRSPLDYPGGKAGDVLTVEFTLAGISYLGLNGGPYETHSNAYSIQIHCETQDECDRLSDALSAVPEAEMCGWVKDRFGLSWQIVPRRLTELMVDPDPTRAKAAMLAMMDMRRIDIAALDRAVAEQTA
jgi:predicted 3-demethylubiquinone-9 3-methyltransferase (glyoxalase superfamily)